MNRKIVFALAFLSTLFMLSCGEDNHDSTSDEVKESTLELIYIEYLNYTEAELEKNSDLVGSWIINIPSKPVGYRIYKPHRTDEWMPNVYYGFSKEWGNMPELLEYSDGANSVIEGRRFERGGNTERTLEIYNKGLNFIITDEGEMVLYDHNGIYNDWTTEKVE